jgi:hypothetical protein
MTKWIKCSDRMPEKDGVYICYTTFGGGCVHTYSFIKDKERFISEQDDDYDPDPVDDITHWRPFPESPREKELNPYRWYLIDFDEGDQCYRMDAITHWAKLPEAPND